MNIYIMYNQNHFTKNQIEMLEGIGNVIFIEEIRKDRNYRYLNDEAEKIILADPDWYDWDISSGHMRMIKNLKAICLSTTAYDWIDLEYCNENNIVVTNIPKYSTNSVAEYAIFYMMGLAKKLPMQLKNGFKMEYIIPMMTTEIYGKTVGIIGLGAIGSRIAELCDNMGMKVMYWNRSSKDNKYQKASIEEIFENADFIFPAYATNSETKKLITDELINKMNNTSFINIINNPKEIYNHELMLEKAAEGKIGYAFEKYDDKTMYDYKGNVFATASYSFYSREAIQRLVSIWCDNAKNIIEDNFQNIVTKK